jgi:hypothetical protein
MTQRLADFIALVTGLRKFLVMAGLMAIAVMFRIYGYISGGEMVDLLKNTAVAFMAANSVERIGETIKHYVTVQALPGKPTPPDEVTSIEEDGGNKS